MADTNISSNSSEWEEISPIFPSGTTDTRFTKAYKNNAIGLVYISVYVIFPNGLSASGTIMSGLPSPEVGGNFIACDYYGDTFTPRNIYVMNGSLNIRGALSAGHGVIGTIIYKI